MAKMVSAEGGRFKITRGGATLIAFDEALEAVEVPGEVAGAPVNRIGPKAFAGHAALGEVILPESVTEIGRAAFADCKSLTEIRLPYGLKRIEDRCFAGCAALSVIYYFSMTGISAVMKSDPTLREDVLPAFIEHIGEAAFADCRSLTSVMIPYQVLTVPARAFEGCESLETVSLHKRITRVAPHAFAGCTRLRELRLPSRCKKIGRNAFAPDTVLVCDEESAALGYAQKTAQRHRVAEPVPVELSSQMIPRRSGEDHVPFYDESVLRRAIDSYEIRHPSYELVNRQQRQLPEATPARFEFDDGVYRGEAKTPGRARIMMVADIMARRRQQNAAAGPEGFGFGFNRVRSLLQECDFAIGNLESTVSPSAPFNSERSHVNARPHLNAPPEFLAAVRGAGFDAVVNAQNHIYDSGTRGLFETLDYQNRFQLMHTGAFASPNDQPYLLVDIGGIRIGVVAFLDGARQPMKRANFTPHGLDTLFPTFARQGVNEHIDAARAAGAEFIIAYAHWGKEYTTDLSPRQRQYAQMLADAGADYIVGAHSHCIQPFTLLKAAGGRTVPCLYSGGNFLCDMNIKPPITRDTLILDLQLERAPDGRVRIASNTYHPCRILEVRRQGRSHYAVFPTNAEVKSESFRKALREARPRIVEAVGDGIEPAH
ncbi:CapA family protein [Leucobacter tenebrionis]|uniref:CapA family protein n=1 Tax=Leucobacter tenebrionis TaxID=2873270 RepID=UPI001CA73F7E|nr:CapA family protein [Leucobacter tenebrionis]QZY53119.1 CapA family protein [Leucobacter tenebrionis]